jgi:hypothetical protein
LAKDERGGIPGKRCVEHANLNLIGIAIRAERKAVDKIVDKLKFHE